MKTALVTGATSGFGKEIALAFAKSGYNLIVTGRRKERLERIEKSLSTEYGISVTPFCFDISNLSECKKHLSQIKSLDVLVNNAGLALGTDPVDLANIDDWEKVIDTNIKGVLYVTRLLLPILKKTKGHIVNIGSTAGRWSYPGGGVYCASKFAIRAFTEVLRWDLDGLGIRVTNVAPGRAETEFSVVRYKGDVSKAKKVYENTTPLSAEDVANAVMWCVDRPVHVNIQELVIVPTDQPGVPVPPKKGQ